jgi:hypothetical protein
MKDNGGVMRLHRCFVLALLCGQAFAYEMPTTPRDRNETMLLSPSDPKLQSPPKRTVYVDRKGGLLTQVRIGVSFTPYKLVTTRLRDGRLNKQPIEGEPIHRVLKTKTEKINHFFVDDWHIETVPVQFIKRAKKLTMRLNIYRRYGSYGELEETVGSMEIQGTLRRGQDGVHIFEGVEEKTLNNKDGEPLLKIAAGFSESKLAFFPLIARNL